jgi:hypothetical protein
LMNVSRRVLVFSSIIFPSLSNTSSAFESISRPPNQGEVPSVRQIGSQAVWASEVPPCPGVIPMTASARPPNTVRMSSEGLDSQSMAFFRAPGMELFYSGVTIKRPSVAVIFFFSSCTVAGIPSDASTSPS